MNSSIRSTTSKLYYHITTHQKHDQCKIVIRLAFLDPNWSPYQIIDTPVNQGYGSSNVNAAIRKFKYNYSLFDSIWWIHSCGCGAYCKCWRPCIQAAICLNIIVERNVMKNNMSEQRCVFINWLLVKKQHLRRRSSSWKTEWNLIIYLRDVSDLQSGGSGAIITIKSF